MKINKSNIDKLKFTDKEEFYWDDDLKGFGIKVTKKKISYIIQARNDRGKTIRKKIGQINVFTPEEARRIAKKYLGDLAQGIDITTREKEEKTKSITLQQAYEEYIKIKTITESTKIKYERSMRLCFKDWANKALTNISREMIENRFLDTSKSSKSIANSDFRFLRAVFNFAMEKYIVNGEPIIPSNPCNRLKAFKLWNKVPRRQSYIHPSQIKTFFFGLQHHEQDTENEKTVKNQCLFILFTGCRDQEAGTLKWCNIDFKLNTITFEHTKNHKEHILPMGEYLRAFLLKLKENNDSIYVFPAQNKSGHVENQRKTVQHIAEISGIKFSLHDIRRTFASIANNHIAGITNFTLKKLLNHSEDDVTAGYIQFETETLRKPMQLIEDYILKQAGVKENETNNVVNIFPIEYGA